MIEKLKARIRAYLLRKARDIVRRDVRQTLARESSAARRAHYAEGTTASIVKDRAYYEGVQRRNALTAEIFRLIPA